MSDIMVYHDGISHTKGLECDLCQKVEKEFKATSYYSQPFAQPKDWTIWSAIKFRVKKIFKIK